ncbi:hypothetical protein GGX14DRAFT_398755 [Mycena pura]|uniref:Uncharacterized protein n=1 Tax=Mycena pura TaxID=153505 RepID=A0AAD6YD95_9AGAR|nr:hypothetical protein GGX14DRAFT_398755 [Mycena pura]
MTGFGADGDWYCIWYLYTKLVQPSLTIQRDVRQIRTNCRDFFLHIEDVYRAGLPTLDIEAYVNLNAPALAARFAPDQGKSTPAESLPIAAKRTGTTTKWTDEDTEWDAASW